MSDECLEGAPSVFADDRHDGCPCRKTGVHRVHRCEHGTEWWLQDARDGRTDPGEGNGTGSGDMEAQKASQGRATGGVIQGPFAFAEPDSDCVFLPWAPGRAGRSAEILAQAATWYGAKVTPPADEDGSRSALDAAIEAARSAIRGHWQEAGGWSGAVTYDSLAEAAVRAAEPILRQAVAEDIARRLDVPGWDYAAEIAREVGHRGDHA